MTRTSTSTRKVWLPPTRGFLYAGASNPLVSLWQVDDVATTKLMVDFYERMLNGMSKAEALQQAKLQMLPMTAILSLNEYS
jgi:CHAT domain-containing protein